MPQETSSGISLGDRWGSRTSSCKVIFGERCGPVQSGNAVYQALRLQPANKQYYFSFKYPPVVGQINWAGAPFR